VTTGIPARGLARPATPLSRDFTLGPEALRPRLAAGLPFSAFARVVYQQREQGAKRSLEICDATVG